jgi:hypothetical protein
MKEAVQIENDKQTRGRTVRAGPIVDLYTAASPKARMRQQIIKVPMTDFVANDGEVLWLSGAINAVSGSRKDRNHTNYANALRIDGLTLFLTGAQPSLAANSHQRCLSGNLHIVSVGVQHRHRNGSKGQHIQSYFMSGGAPHNSWDGPTSGFMSSSRDSILCFPHRAGTNNFTTGALGKVGTGGAIFTGSADLTVTLNGASGAYPTGSVYAFIYATRFYSSWE